MRLNEVPLHRPLAEVLAAPPGPAVRLYWLGQAGFVIEGGGRRAVIDPYLSDSLAEKYRGKAFPHLRMMPAPIAPSGIGHVDLVLASHAHTDHLDPSTLPELLHANPRAMLLAPRSAREAALQRSGVEPARLCLIDAGESRDIAGIGITAARAAHETLECDADGCHRFLGFALRLGGATVFHSGDTVPFPGQVEEVRALAADLALFPVNGRDARRAAQGVPGNLTLAEALALARATGIPALIAHHFDMFDFNTVPRTEVEAVTRSSERPQAVAAAVGMTYCFGQSAVERSS